MELSPTSNKPTAVHPSRHKESFRRQALWALVIVVVLEMLILWAENTSLWESYQRPFHDWFMRLRQGEDINPIPDAPKLAFIDIDDAAHDKWGKSGVTNRDRLLDLIRYAAEGGARLIIVDLDLSQPDPSDSKSDSRLRAWLQHYPSKADLKAELIFVRPLGSPSTVHAAWNIQHTIIDKDVANNPLVHFATAAFTADTDGVVRRWRLWEPVCQDDKLLVALPSVELQTEAIIDVKNKEGTSTELSGILKSAVRGQCDQFESGIIGALNFKQFKEVELYPDPRGEDILYMLPWHVPPDWDEQRLAYMPAQTIVEKNPSPDRVRGRVVMIGGSNAASRDFMQTPIGPMPGAMVLLNSINALLQEGQLRDLPWYGALGIGVVLGMSVWLCLYSFHYGLAPLLAMVSVVLVTMFAASELIKYGIWLDMTGAFVGIVAHWSIEAIEDIRHKWPTHGVRSLLAERFRGGPLALAFIAGLAASAGSARAAGPVVGYISAIYGDRLSFKVGNCGKKDHEVRIWANVCTGDRIVVSGQGRIEISPDGPVVTQANSPVTIEATHPVTWVQTNLERLGRMLSVFSDEENHGRVVQAMSKDVPGPMALPLLAGTDHQLIVAGTRRLTMAWTGGTPPFTATLTSSAGGTLTLTPAANGVPRASAKLQLGEGRYEVRITDAKGTTRSAQFEAVANQPTLSEAGFANEPDDVRLAMAAMQLAKAEGGHWRLEAFQRLIEAAPVQYVARLLSNRLADGKPLDDPQ
jgi:CHASE2 domain-containing sensor protein